MEVVKINKAAGKITIWAEKPDVGLFEDDHLAKAMIKILLEEILSKLSKITSY
jgi:hypothetical protein